MIPQNPSVCHPYFVPGETLAAAIDKCYNIPHQNGGVGMERNILYHYTDFQAVDGILRCAQLRVNNVLRMNDAGEMRHFMNRLCSAVVQQLQAEGREGQAKQIRELFDEELKKEYSAFAACFSFHRDDAAQWERYGNRGRGVCIAFRRDYLQKIAKGALSLQPVFYQNDMSGHPMVEVFCDLVQRNCPLSGEDPDIRRAMRDAWACSVSFKHPSFRTEYEMRLVVSPFEAENFNVKPCYHVTTERIKKYYPLNLLSMCQEIGIGIEDLVAEIIIGPDSTQSLAIFQDYLQDNGLPTLVERVSLSDCPLRGIIRWRD